MQSSCSLCGDCVGFTALCPSGTIRWLRGKTGFINICQLNVACLRLPDQFGDFVLGLFETLGITLFFKL